MSAISFAPLTARAAAVTKGTAVSKRSTAVRASAARVNTVTSAELKATKDASLGEVMAFSGVAPELINGRLAMLGFVACVGAEAATGECFNEQVAAAPLPIVATAVIFSLASLMPKLKGGEMNPGFGWSHLKGSRFSDVSSIEMLNGRAAMVGLASLIVLEKVNGHPLF